jgi:tellurite methyltransferase
MRRHAGRQGLSREHHHALVLARLLRTGIADAADSAGGASFLDRVRSTWSTHLAAHFAVEERELLPLCHGAGAELASHAATIGADHAALRAMLAELERAAPPPTTAPVMADRLEGHVRFEERVWFPALEAALDEETLTALQWRLEPEPSVPIVGFHPDPDEPSGSWIASLACGHRQHVRHKPPFQNAAWVMTPEGRASQIGTRLRCLLCRMPRLPPKAAVYKETAVFDESSVPAGLLASHTLRAGTWGQIVVLEGKVDYVIEDAPPLAFVLRPGVDGAVAPERPHHVALQPGARFQVRFLR